MASRGRDSGSGRERAREAAAAAREAEQDAREAAAEAAEAEQVRMLHDARASLDLANARHITAVEQHKRLKALVKTAEAFVHTSSKDVARAVEDVKRLTEQLAGPSVRVNFAKATLAVNDAMMVESRPAPRRFSARAAPRQPAAPSAARPRPETAAARRKRSGSKDDDMKVDSLKAKTVKKTRKAAADSNTQVTVGILKNILIKNLIKSKPNVREVAKAALGDANDASLSADQITATVKSVLTSLGFADVHVNNHTTDKKSVEAAVVAAIRASRSHSHSPVIAVAMEGGRHRSNARKG